MRRLRSMLTYGNVTATLAVFLAMSGAAAAVTTAPTSSVVSSSIKDGEVRTPDLATGAATTAKLRDGAVNNAKIAANSIGSGKVVDGSLTGADVRDDSVSQNELMASSVGTPQLLDNAVASAKIQPGAVTSREIADKTVGAQEVKGLTTATSPVGTSISPGHAGNAEVTCPNGGMVVGGGFAWENDAFTWTISSTPSETDPSHTWTVRGYVPGGGNGNRLYGWASCLSL
jgi:hypothetical protein